MTSHRCYCGAKTLTLVRHHSRLVQQKRGQGVPLTVGTWRAQCGAALDGSFRLFYDENVDGPRTRGVAARTFVRSGRRAVRLALLLAVVDMPPLTVATLPVLSQGVVVQV